VILQLSAGHRHQQRDAVDPLEIEVHAGEIESHVDVEFVFISQAILPENDNQPFQRRDNRGRLQAHRHGWDAGGVRQARADVGRRLEK